MIFHFKIAFQTRTLFAQRADYKWVMPMYINYIYNFLCWHRDDKKVSAFLNSSYVLSKLLCCNFSCHLKKRPFYWRNAGFSNLAVFCPINDEYVWSDPVCFVYPPIQHNVHSWMGANEWHAGKKRSAILLVWKSLLEVYFPTNVSTQPTGYLAFCEVKCGIY